MANKYSAQQMIDAIRQAEGNLSAAARIVGCSRTTVHRYVNDYSTVKDAYDEANETAIDLAENELMKQVKKGSIPAIIFFLKTKGKHRGYVERQEHTGADGGALNVVVRWPEQDADAND